MTRRNSVRTVWRLEFCRCSQEWRQMTAIRVVSGASARAQARRHRCPRRRMRDRPIRPVALEARFKLIMEHSAQAALDLRDWLGQDARECGPECGPSGTKARIGCAAAPAACTGHRPTARRDARAVDRVPSSRRFCPSGGGSPKEVRDGFIPGMQSAGNRAAARNAHSRRQSNCH